MVLYMVSYICGLMAIYGLIWSYMVTHVDMHGHICFIHGIMLSYRVLYVVLWSYIVLYVVLCSYMVLHVVLWSYMVLYVVLWSYMVLPTFL